MLLQLIHLQAFQSLKLDSSYRHSAVKIYVFKVCSTGKILEYCSCHIHVLLKNFFSRYSQDQDHESTRTETVTGFFTRNAVLCFYDNYFVAVR